MSTESDWHIDPSAITPGKELGRGSFGVVRAAVWRHTPVAIKILYQDAQSEDRSLFEAEVAMMTTLHHPNIVQFLGYTRTPSLTLVIEYFPEGSLDDYVRKHKSNHKTSLRFCFEMACAIEYLHSRTPSIVIHRDIKPANFLLTASHRVKLGDFGIARTRRHHDHSQDPTSMLFQPPHCSGDAQSGTTAEMLAGRAFSSITDAVSGSGEPLSADPPRADPPPVNRAASAPTAGALAPPGMLNRAAALPSTEDLTSNCGTVRFMAPEVASPDGHKRFLKYTSKADIFSLALVFYFVWERVLPAIPNHNTPASHFAAIRQNLRPPLTSKTPKAAKELIQRMWVFDARQRPSASELLDQLADLRTNHGTYFAGVF